jgi:predicted SAM-dependent methyltransferase
MNDVKLHLGCGKRYLPGYIHIDLDREPHIDYPNTDIRDLSMFSDESVDVIYNCGTFEYFDPSETSDVLREWLRVLNPEGILRISVPNFESIVSVYLQNGKDINGEGVLGPLYGKWEITPLSNVKETLFHKTVYDYRSLASLLTLAGFSDVKHYNWKDVLPPEYDDYSKAYVPYKDDTGIQMHLNIEGRK